MNNDKIVCIIPARANSKRLKNKNTRVLNGKPLISWTIEEAKKSVSIDRIVISTDDEEAVKIGLDHGVEVIRRPEELAMDTTTTAEVIFHALDLLKEISYYPGHILLLQCTSPLRKAWHIDEAIKYYLDNLSFSDSLISVSKSEHPPWWLKKISENGLMTDFLEYDKEEYKRSQDFPETFRINGALYLAKTEMFRKFRGFQTPKTLAYKMEALDSLDIDTEIDFLFAEFIMKTYYSCQ
ncbi:MAG: acylneuraminate cytidylyltransferase family protein [Bacillota bacterium]|nr:acylneuraminate cytidylyltransferase family protein [Bacillota bacterium]